MSFVGLNYCLALVDLGAMSWSGLVARLTSTKKSSASDVGNSASRILYQDGDIEEEMWSPFLQGF